MPRRRRFPRLGKEWQTKYRVIDPADLCSHAVAEIAVNISGGGLRFSVEEPIPHDAMIALELVPADRSKSMIALAKVEWCRRAMLNGRHEVGVEFWWLGWQEATKQELVANYVNASLGRA